MKGCLTFELKTKNNQEIISLSCTGTINNSNEIIITTIPKFFVNTIDEDIKVSNFKFYYDEYFGDDRFEIVNCNIDTIIINEIDGPLIGYMYNFNSNEKVIKPSIVYNKQCKKIEHDNKMKHDDKINTMYEIYLYFIKLKIK